MGSASQPEIPTTAGIDEEDTSSNQEAVPIPYLAGQSRCKVIWISPIYNKFKLEDTSAATASK